MDQPHFSSQLEYLERRHQEDQQRIAQLHQLIEGQSYDLQEQARRIQRLEDDLAATRLKLNRIPQLDERLDHFKEEIVRTLEQRLLNQRAATPDFSQSHLASQVDNYTKTLNELRRDVDRTRRYDEQIGLARTEIERLNKVVSTFEARVNELNKKLDERSRSVEYLEEQRRTDAQRLAEFQVELPKLQKQIEANLSKIQMVQQQMPQFGKYEVAIEEMRDEIRRHREHLDFQMAQRERLMKNWTEMAEDQERRLSENEKLMEKYVEHYQLNKRALASLQEFQERLQREQHQAEELQRLAEERQRATLEKLQADYEQRWQKQGMEWKPQIFDLRKGIESLEKQLDGLKKSGQNLSQQIDMILQILEEDIQARTTSMQTWQSRFEEIASGRG